MRSNHFLPTALFLSLACISISAQPKKVAKPINGGVVNGKAISLPKPDYPEDARLAKIAGKVEVEVVISENGTVESAKAVRGLEGTAFRTAAEAAALRATFSSTLLSGQPVKVTGVIVYNFVLTPAGYEDELRPMEMATALTMIRSFATDQKRFQAEFPESDPFGPKQFEEFPEFEKEFSTLYGLEKMPPADRPGAIDKTKAAIRAKLDTSGRWQFDAGIALGDMVNEFALIADDSEDGPNFEKLDQAKVKLALNTISDLTLSAPTDFPPAVLQKLKDLAAYAAKPPLSTPQEYLDFSTKMMALFDLISPGDTK